MPETEDYKNNPLYKDITKLDFDTPSPTFSYNWNSESGRWEPAGGVSVDNLNIDSLEIDFSETNSLLSGISGVLSNTNSSTNDQETHRLLSGISGALSNTNSGTNDQETHRLLSGISGALSNTNSGTNDQETHRLLSGISGALSNTNSSTNDQETHRLLSGISGSLSNTNSGTNDQETHRLLSGISGSLSTMSNQDTLEILSGISGEIENIDLNQIETSLSGISGEIYKQNYNIVSKIVNQKIEEDFILLENMPNDKRFGEYSSISYGENRSIMDDIFNTYYDSARKLPNTPETGHPDFFIFNESTDLNRGVESKHVFHSDTQYALRFDNPYASELNSYELKDFSDLYKKRLINSITIFNESSFPLQFHTLQDHQSENSPPEYLHLHSNSAVEISSDEASKIFIKRPHTISGYTVKYIISYKQY